VTRYQVDDWIVFWLVDTGCLQKKKEKLILQHTPLPREVEQNTLWPSDFWFRIVDPQTAAK